MKSRRDFLKSGIGIGAGLLIPWEGGVSRAFAIPPPLPLLDPLTQPKFINPLPLPGAIDGTTGYQEITISQFNQQLGLFDPITGAPLDTTVWGYNGSYPGPTIVARKNVPLSVRWKNELVNGGGTPLKHLFPIDTTIDWAGVTSSVPVVTHLHGGHTDSASDGLPDAWFTAGNFHDNYYRNDQEAGTLWYHDHALGITRLNVYAGLAGFYLLRDGNEDALVDLNNLPSGPYEIGLAIQDRMFLSDGSLYYPTTPAVPGAPDPSILPEFFGDTILVNGMSWPFLDVEPRQYRFRMLNGSDSRFYALYLSTGQPFFQIGTDLGLLNSPVPLSMIVFGPGERVDVVIDFAGFEGQTIIMKNNARSPYPKGIAPNPSTVGQIMAFRVGNSASGPSTTLPTNLRPDSGPIVPLGPAVKTRKLLLFEAMDEYGRLKPMLGTVTGGVMTYNDPITENPSLDTTEIWEVYNTTPDAHPIHLHLTSFQILNRQKFTATQNIMTGALSRISLKGQPKPPAANEAGPKDTAQMFPGEVTRIIAKFDIAGEYVWHCHILSHEDHEMMRRYQVV